MRRLLPTVFILLSPPAFAACPTMADIVGGGVYVDFSDGTYVHYRQTGPDVVGEITYTPDEAGNFFSGRYRGVYLTIDAPLAGDGPDPETLIAFEPAPGADDWPAVAPGMSWAGEVVTRDANGRFINRFEMKVDVIGEDAIHISGCDYDVDVLRIEEVYETGDGVSQLNYIRALGVGYVAAAGALGEEFEFHYVPRWIGLKPPR